MIKIRRLWGLDQLLEKWLAISLFNIQVTYMKQNLGIADRLIRLITGVVLFNLSVRDIMPGSDNMICWVFATLLLLNAALGISLVYAFFGVGTISAKSKTYGNVLK